MALFEDKRFESLDWISQATEPIESHLNDLLASLPDETNIDIDFFISLLRRTNTLDISKESVIANLVSSIMDKHISFEERQVLESCFVLETDGNIEINLDTRTMTGSIRLIKTVFTLEDKILQRYMGKEGLNHVSWMSIPPDGGASRLKDVAELLGKCDEAIATRSSYKKRTLVVSRLSDILRNNEWNVKSSELADKIGKWIAEYVETGNAAAYSNFCRLKVMTHKGQAIYSMTEELT